MTARKLQPGREEPMIEQIFTNLSHAVEGAPLVALASALVWGIFSVLLSPCHLACIPLVVGFINRQGQITVRRAFAISLLFSIGILITIGAIGIITAAAGRILGDVGRWGNYAVAALFLAAGLYLLDALRLPLPTTLQPKTKGKGMLAAFSLGLVFGIALGPCTFAFLAPMLVVTFRLAGTNLAYGILLLLLYGIGHCGVIVLAGTFAEAVQQYLDWNEKSRGAVFLRKACGVLVLLGGLYLIYTAR